MSEMVERVRDAIADWMDGCQEARCTYPMSENCECALAAGAAIAAMRESPGADAMERAGRVLKQAEQYVADPTGASFESFHNAVQGDIARAIQQHGDERAAAATEAERRRCATIDHIDIDLIRREAREAAIEEAAQTALEYRDEADGGQHPDIGDPNHSLGQGYAANVIAKRIRALAAKPGSEP